MKINSAFHKPCPTCRRAIPEFFGKPDAAWKCVACEMMICVWCYNQHTVMCCPNWQVWASPTPIFISWWEPAPGLE